MKFGMYTPASKHIILNFEHCLFCARHHRTRRSAARARPRIPVYQAKCMSWYILILPKLRLHYLGTSITYYSILNLDHQASVASNAAAQMLENSCWPSLPRPLITAVICDV